jgi:hypothetical protein
MDIGDFLNAILNVIDKGYAETMGCCDVIIDGCRDFNITLKSDEDGVKRLEIVSLPTS